MNENRSPGAGSSTVEFATRATIAVTLLCLGVVALWLSYLAIDVMLAIFGGVVIAVLLHTIAEPLTRRLRIPMWAAVLVTVLAVLGLLTLGIWLMAAPISRQFDELSVRLPEAIDRLRAQFLSTKWSDWIMAHSEGATDGQKILHQVTRAFSLTMTAAAGTIIVLFLALYMAASPATYVNGLTQLVPISYRARAQEIMRELYRMLRLWLLTKLISMLFVGVCVAAGLWLMKVPFALSLGVLAGVFEFIPTVGPLLSAAPAVLLALTKDPMMALYVVLLYFGVQWVQNHVTNPLLQQRTLALPPALTLALLALLGTFFGFSGLLWSGPLSVVVVVLVKKLYIEDVLERRGRRRNGHRLESRRYERHDERPRVSTHSVPTQVPET